MNYYDGCQDHIFNSHSGRLYHHALVNEKTHWVYRSGVTGRGFVEVKSRLYRECGSPVEFPSQATILRVWLQFIILQTSWRDKRHLFIDPFCDRAIGTRIPVAERKPEQRVRFIVTDFIKKHFSKTFYFVISLRVRSIMWSPMVCAWECKRSWWVVCCLRRPYSRRISSSK